ncbi:MAG: SDR family oxidoreductase [Proteobacteria bacterium]|nr:SDR family oxidoreductase [Pseudomonadota bacterium]
MTDLHGKTIVITGATDGVGKEAAARIAQAGAALILVSRNQAKGRAVVEQMRQQTGNDGIAFLQADLSRFADVRRVAADIRGRCARIDVLLNNAGALFMARAESADGIEMTFALNHLSYFLLTNELIDLLKESTSARIVNVASQAHRRGHVNFDDIENRTGYAGWRAYSQSKLANILFTNELARRLAGTNITVNALHPGFVRTRFGSNNSLVAKVLIAIAMRVSGVSVEAGGKTSVYVAIAPEIKGMTGGYYDRCRAVRSSAESYDEGVAARLWELSERMTGITR